MKKLILKKPILKKQISNQLISKKTVPTKSLQIIHMQPMNNIFTTQTNVQFKSLKNIDINVMKKPVMKKQIINKFIFKKIPIKPLKIIHAQPMYNVLTSQKSVKFKRLNNINVLNKINIETNIKNGHIYIVIFTYERYEKLCNLLNDIDKYMKNYNIVVNIFDDASKKEQIFKNNKYKFPINYYKFKYNHGKKKWYKMHEYIMSILQNTDFKYYIYLADDMRLVDNFFDKCIQNFNEIKDINKICLNINNDKGIINQWTNKRPIKYNDNIWKTYWVDMCFISNHTLFKKLNYRFNDFKEQTNPNLSSGVGKYISNYFCKRDYNMYQAKKSLVIHDGNDDSKMNGNIRKNNKLISKI